MSEQYSAKPSTSAVARRATPNEKQLQAACSAAQMPRELVILTWNTVASQARDINDFLLFLMFCKENQVSALRGEATMQIRKDRNAGIEKPVFVVGYQVFVRRALKAGFLLCPMAVHEKDDFAFDAGTYAVRHRFAADRGRCIGAYCLVKLKRTMQTVAGMYLPTSELEQNTPVWGGMRGTMAMKTVAERMARYCIEELTHLHGSEEMGVTMPEATTNHAVGTPQMESSLSETVVEEQPELEPEAPAENPTADAIHEYLNDSGDGRFGTDYKSARIAEEIANRKCRKHGAKGLDALTQKQLEELLADLVERFDKAPPQAPSAPAANAEEKPASGGAPEPAPRQRSLIVQDVESGDNLKITPKEVVGLEPLDPFAGKVEKRNDEWLESYYHVKKLAKANAVNMGTVTTFLEKKKFRWVAQLTTDQISELIAILERAGE